MNFTNKVVIIGDDSLTVEKMKFFEEHLAKPHIVSNNVSIYPLRFFTNYGILNIDIWDCAGYGKVDNLRQEFFEKAHGVLCACDNITLWSFYIKEDVPKIPSILCGSNKETHKKFVDNLKLPHLKYVNKKNSFEEYFLRLIRKITKNDKLLFIGFKLPLKLTYLNFNEII